MGKTWKTVAGKVLQTPAAANDKHSLVRDYKKAGLLVYLKDINFDSKGNPVILYITSKNHKSGPQTPARSWDVAYWQSGQWEFRRLTDAWNNYDMGSLYIETDGTWRIIAPTESGPQKWATGGEIAVWESKNQGKDWQKTKDLTTGSARNHTYVRRPVNAHESLYAFWCDGDGLKQSPSRLYFADKAGRVWMLPEKMSSSFAKPKLVQGAK